MALVGSISGSFGLVGVSGSMEPSVDDAYSFGNSGKKWKSIVASALSGSLTNLADGSSFLVAGTNITITTASNGAVTIASTAAGESFFSSTTNGSIFTTGSAAFVGAEAIDSPSDKGADVVFYVSGAAGDPTARKVAVFGGDVTVSGSVRINDNVTGAAQVVLGNDGLISGSSSLQAGGNLTVAGNAAINGGDITTTASTFNIVNAAATVNLGAASTTVNIGQASNAINVAGNLDVNGTTDLAGAVTLSGNSQTVTHTGTGNLTIASTSGNVVVENTIFNGNDVTVPGNLTVNGSLVSVDTTNLRIKDPVVLIGSGSGATDSKSAIAFGSGSAGGTNSLIVGSIGGGNVIAAAQQDVEAGALAASSLNFTNLVPFRASKFEVGGTSAYVTSSVGNDLTVASTGDNRVASTTGVVILSGSSGRGTSFEIGGIQFAELKDNSTNAQFGATGGKQLFISGSGVTLNVGGAVNVQRDGARVGQFIGTAGSSFRVSAIDGSGISKNLVLTGSGIDLGANNTAINLNFADTTRGSFSYSPNNLQVGSTPGVSLTLSGANGVNVIHGTPGANFIKDFGGTSYLTVEADASDARLRSAADLVLRADGNDIKFNNSTNTVLTLTTAGNNANLQGANNQNITIGAVGPNGVMVVSGSKVNINAGTSGVVFYKDWSETLLLNAQGTTTIMSGSASQNVTLAAGTGATTLALSGSAVNLVGSTVNLYQDSTLVAYAGSIGGTRGFFPNADLNYNLGDPSRRWANIYTGDLHLRNDRGNWTIIEEADYLTITNNLNGKRYKFVMEEL